MAYNNEPLILYYLEDHKSPDQQVEKELVAGGWGTARSTIVGVHSYYNVNQWLNLQKNVPFFDNLDRVVSATLSSDVQQKVDIYFYVLRDGNVKHFDHQYYRLTLTKTSDGKNLTVFLYKLSDSTANEKEFKASPEDLNINAEAYLADYIIDKRVQQAVSKHQKSIKNNNNNNFNNYDNFTQYVNSVGNNENNDFNQDFVNDNNDEYYQQLNNEDNNNNNYNYNNNDYHNQQLYLDNFNKNNGNNYDFGQSFGDNANFNNDNNYYNNNNAYKNNVDNTKQQQNHQLVETQDDNDDTAKTTVKVYVFQEGHKSSDITLQNKSLKELQAECNNLTQNLNDKRVFSTGSDDNVIFENGKLNKNSGFIENLIKDFGFVDDLDVVNQQSNVVKNVNNKINYNNNYNININKQDDNDQQWTVKKDQQTTVSVFTIDNNGQWNAGSINIPSLNDQEKFKDQAQNFAGNIAIQTQTLVQRFTKNNLYICDRNGNPDKIYDKGTQKIDYAALANALAGPMMIHQNQKLGCIIDKVTNHLAGKGQVKIEPQDKSQNNNNNNNFNNNNNINRQPQLRQHEHQHLVVDNKNNVNVNNQSVNKVNNNDNKPAVQPEKRVINTENAKAQSVIFEIPDHVRDIDDLYTAMSEKFDTKENLMHSFQNPKKGRFGEPDECHELVWAAGETEFHRDFKRYVRKQFGIEKKKEDPKPKLQLQHGNQQVVINNNNGNVNNNNNNVIINDNNNNVNNINESLLPKMKEDDNEDGNRNSDNRYSTKDRIDNKNNNQPEQSSNFFSQLFSKKQKKPYETELYKKLRKYSTSGWNHTYNERVALALIDISQNNIIEVNQVIKTVVDKIIDSDKNGKGSLWNSGALKNIFLEYDKSFSIQNYNDNNQRSYEI